MEWIFILAFLYGWFIYGPKKFKEDREKGCEPIRNFFDT